MNGKGFIGSYLVKALSKDGHYVCVFDRKIENSELTSGNIEVKKIVFFSSGGTVYGNLSVNHISKTHPLNPICSYGIVKVAIEKYLFLFNQLHGLEYNILSVQANIEF